MLQQVMKRGVGIGMEDLIEERPVFEGDGFRIGECAAAGLPEEIISNLFEKVVAKKGRANEDTDLSYPRIPKIKFFQGVISGGEAEGGVVGFHIELQKEGRRGGWLDSDDQVIAERYIDDQPGDAGIEIAGPDIACYLR
jgi:hypothetical protein